MPKAKRSKRKKKPKTLADLQVGDVVGLDGERWRLCVKLPGSWGCRKIMPDGGDGHGHEFFCYSRKFDSLEEKRPPVAQDAGEVYDPLGGTGR